MVCQKGKPQNATFGNSRKGVNVIKSEGKKKACSEGKKTPPKADPAK
jgi:hypothetical protein